MVAVTTMSPRPVWSAGSAVAGSVGAGSVALGAAAVGVAAVGVAAGGVASVGVAAAKAGDAIATVRAAPASSRKRRLAEFNIEGFPFSAVFALRGAIGGGRGTSVTNIRIACPGFLMVV
ncbi:hypothetical protein SPHINGO391_500180 [Sphingomonas aurantiaca]|uniref:Uncharacterized protein n=1 Tax=Sphingomonas aurantiaca TaxID=185949 RepID=A0A5E8AAD8_9SPHN|nr:hypothetical protein SPHINGO391_500180 [Sphingomonas aurantiaca]